MRNILRWIRAITLTLILMAVGIPASLFIALSLPPIQRWIKDTVQNELSSTLNSHVVINDMAISPFNRVTLFGVSITDSYQSEAITVDRLGAGISLTDLIFFGDFVVNYVEIIGLHGRLYRETKDSELNINNIIEALKPKDEKNTEKSFRLSINNIILRNNDFSYDILSEPQPSADRFNRNHIKIEKLRADISVPILSNNTYAADVYRLALEEASGLQISNLHGRFFLNSDSVTVSGLGVELPHSSLNLSDLKLEFHDNRNIRSVLTENILSFSTTEPSYITPSDVACFFPPLTTFNSPLDIQLKLVGSAEKISLEPLFIKSPESNDLTIAIAGTAYNLLDNDGRRVDFDKIDISSTGRRITSLLAEKTSPKVCNIIDNIGNFSLAGKLKLDESSIDSEFRFDSENGQIDINLDVSKIDFRNLRNAINYSLDLDFSDIDLSSTLNNKNIGAFTGTIHSEGSLIQTSSIKGETTLTVEKFYYGEYLYQDILIDAISEKHRVDVYVLSNNEGLKIEGNVGLGYGHEKALVTDLQIINFNPSYFDLPGFKDPYGLSVHVMTNLSWQHIDDITGEIFIDDLNLTNDGEISPLIRILSVNIEGEENRKEINIKGDRLDGNITGEINFSSLKECVMRMGQNLIPVLLDNEDFVLSNDNNFSFDIQINDTEWLTPFIKLPVSSLSDVTITGYLNSYDGTAKVDISAPYLRQGNKLLEDSRVNFTLTTPAKANLFINTKYPTKNGLLDLFVVNDIETNKVDTDIKWIIESDKLFSGDIGLNTIISRDYTKSFSKEPIHCNIVLRESTLSFNDSIWNIRPSIFEIIGNEYFKIDHLFAYRSGQSIEIDGTISKEPADEIEVVLDNINLDYIFETLAINNVTIGGDATGSFTGSSLLTSEPHLSTSGLKVRNISYNSSVVGDAVINSGWNTENRSIDIDADITQSNNEHTFIRGSILPLNDSLDLTFIPSKVQIGFLKPYMQAFSSELSGYASGEARLWGNFHDIDLVAKLYADSVRMRVDFTDVTYMVSDSVIMTPGKIMLENITLHDEEGHTANFNGVVTHTFFKQPHFEFNMTDADNLLVLNESEISNPKWHGKVYADGSATIKGGPGYVNISCDLETAQGTTFSFVLNDMQQAGEYTFITFRDRDFLSIQDSLIMADNTPKLVKEFRSRQQKIVEDSHSIYTLDFNVAINPSAQIILVMDPEGGDRIRAYGSGDIRMSFESNDEDLKIYGTYTLSKGDYNFSLQEIIIKDFTIRDGSSITFRGDPYTASLDITAVYSLTANLSDLDAQFLEDKDISRTNVPVHALLHVSGDLHQPDISFDLEFPTLTQDTYRKVKSIISTEDMMNRQIIYLLALSRFYTPDYMQSATKGNELISVASSTLSSQLSNILGQISENWTIAPSIKSERTDFSDVEFDLALSSSLLNNRLLLNGNFGYRDNMLNTNQFIGDFDIEYLLNRKGTLRLKAYNRYNDRNFYFKTAATTQGVGIMIKHDFDSFLNFLKFFQKDKKQEQEND